MVFEPHNKWLVLFIVAMNGFLIILDFSSVNIAFPALTTVFATDISIVLWVSAAFTLVSASLTPVFGRLADLYGHKRIFILGYVLFTTGLVLCSLAQNIAQLIAFRSIQGIGAAMNLALSFAIATSAFPANQRGTALGILTSVFSIGPLVGFSLAGALLEFLSWQALFYTRVPLCVLGIFMAWKYLGRDSVARNTQRLDLLGAGLLFSSIVCLVVSLNVGSRHGFHTGHVLLLGSMGALLFLFFIFQERRHKWPVVDLGLYRSVQFRDASFSLVIVGTIQSGQIFLLPFLLQRGYSFTALEAGLILATLPTLHFLVAPLSGVLSDRLGTRPMCLAGMGFILCAAAYRISPLSVGITP